MKASLHGEVSGPGVAAIGVWDPISAVQRDLFRRLSVHAKEHGLDSVAIAIDPHPAAYRSGEPVYPVYTDLGARIRLILACGIDGVACVRFRRRDVHRGVTDLIAAVWPIIEIAELWLGANQTLGRLEAGDAAAVDAVAKQRGIKVTRLEDQPRPNQEVRQLLRAGRIRAATRIVGHPPFRTRPRIGMLKFGWAPGRYRTTAASDPGAGLLAGAPMTLELTGEDGHSARLAWPDPTVEYLAFVSGPGDTS